MKIDWKVIWEAAKEPLRLLALALIPLALTYVEAISAEWAVAIVFILRFVDKYLHELGKQVEDENLELGLTRF